MAFYKQDIVDVNLETGVIHRSFLNHTIGHKDDDADRFGIRAFRNGEPVDLSGAQCQAVFMAPDGTNIALTSYGTVSENVAYVTLPQACYNVEGQFCLAIKLVGGGVTATVRIIDGVVDRTGVTGAVAPTEAVPTYQEILAVYAEMQEDVADYESVVATQNGKIDDLKSAYKTGKGVIDANWAKGKIGNTGYSASDNYKVSTVSPITLNKYATVECSSPFKFKIYIDNDTKNVCDWSTSKLIPDDRAYLISITKDPQEEVTDIKDYVNALKVTQNINCEIDELKYCKHDNYACGNLIDKDHLFPNSIINHADGSVTAGNFYVTDFIEVFSGEVLQCRGVNSWYCVFYNTSKEYVNYFILSNNTYTVPADGFVRLSISDLSNAYLTRWLNWSDNSKYKKSAIDIPVRNAITKNGSYNYDLYCGVIAPDGSLYKYISPSIRATIYPPIYISEGKVNISIDSPYQWSAGGYKDGSLVAATSWTNGSGSIVVNQCDFVAVTIRKYVNGSEQAMTGYENYGLTISVSDAIKIVPEYGDFSKTLIKAKEKAFENEPYSFGIGTMTKIMSHLFIDGVYEGSNPIIPSQSIHDVEALARLGIHFAEGNVHRTSDGYYVVSHGVQGKLGSAFETNEGQPVGDVTFAGQTLEQLKTLYRFRSTHAKYRTRILTLDEWLYACMKNNIIPLVQPSAITIDREFVDHVQEITGNKVVISYEGNTGIRDYYNGVIINYSSQTNLSQINLTLYTVGAPFIWCIESTAMANLTESQLKAIVDLVHSYGCLAIIPGFYLTVPQRIMAMRCGFDILGSGWDVEDFHDGNIDHLIGDITFDDFYHEGTVTNETLILESGKWVSNVNNDNIHIGKGSLHIKFSGTIHIEMGRYINTDITSDGTEDVWLSTVFLDERPIFNIQTQSAVTVYNLLYDSSEC